MRFERKKWWYYLLIILFVGSIWLYIQSNKQTTRRIRVAAELATVSDVSICTADGKSVLKRDDSSLFIVPNDMKRLYICGSLQITVPHPTAIYLYKRDDDRAFYSKGSPELLKPGPFIIDVISIEKLDPGEYRANFYILREKPAASIRFLIEK
jgi:hypothetical protein